MAQEPRGGVFGRRGRSEPAGSTDGFVDPLTGLASRQRLHEMLSDAIEHSRARSTLAVLAFAEAGLLRDIDDLFGPEASDQLLRLVADRLRTIDVPGTRVLRYHSAQFVVIFEQVPNALGAEEIARYIIELLSPPFDLDGDHVTIDVRVGAAVSTDSYELLDDMVRDAHQALVQARDSGATAYVVHDETKRAHFSTRIDERRLRQGFDSGEFSLFYQPIVRLDTEDLIGVEALLRWAAPGATNTGILLPHDFLPLLERSGLIIEVGEWVIDEACSQTALWDVAHPGREPLFITCNLGARQLADPEFTSKVTRSLERHGIGANQLCLDITEATLQFNRDTTWSSLRQVKDLGVRLGLDDFGVGVTSLGYLREFSLDILRIDRSFVQGLGLGREDAIIVKHITALAHDLECVAIGEGVETPEQASMLRDLSVDLAQGFHFGRPEPADAITARLREPDEEEPPDPWDTTNVLTPPA